MGDLTLADLEEMHERVVSLGPRPILTKATDLLALIALAREALERREVSDV